MYKITENLGQIMLSAHISYIYIYTFSLCRKTKELVRELSSPAEDSKELHFSTCFPQNGWEQFKACLWKQHLSYWRSPKYNLARLTFITTASLLFGAVLWRRGKQM